MILLEPWGPGDFWLLEAQNTPEMMEFIGGPETSEQLRNRQERYVKLTSTGPGCMFRVVLDGTGETAGSIGFWEREWKGEQVYETGWGVLPGFQGRGVAVAAAVAVAEHAKLSGRHRYLHAYPDVAHGASNAICRKAGFELLGEVSFEYPKGHWKTSNDWRFDLFA
jgi:RimJ/RimL family protein N-acetyltransferase